MGITFDTSMDSLDKNFGLWESNVSKFTSTLARVIRDKSSTLCWIEAVVTDGFDIVIYTKNYKNGIWTDWKQLATTEKLQELPLPLVSGFSATAKCSFYKNQFNEVTVTGAIKKDNGSIIQGETLAVLPKSFTPRLGTAAPATAFSPFAAGYVNVDINGNIHVNFQSTEAQSAWFPFTFLAE